MVYRYNEGKEEEPMPWKETCTMNGRLKFVAEYLKEEESLSVLCGVYGVSRPTAYKWIHRYESLGPAGLAEKSRAPQRHSNQTLVAIEQKIIALRQRKPRWGPRKLVARLEKLEPEVAWPAVSTAGEILKRHGLTHPRKRCRKAPVFEGPWQRGSRPNDVWAADFKGWFCTRDGTRVDPLTISDWASRYLIACQILKTTRLADVQGEFKRRFREQGMPWAIRTDNGPPFASVGLAGLSRLAVWWIRLGIMPERIRPGHPEENGRHERMHETLKADTARPPRDTPRGQQAASDAFRREYNHARPHEALGMGTPAEYYRASERPFPERLPEIEYGSDMEVRRVRSNGQIKWGGEILYLSQALIGQWVGFKRIAERAWSVHFGPIPLATVDSFTRRLTPWPPRLTGEKV
jgi:putative transposase